MSDLFGKILLVAFGALLPALGFLLKRRIEGRGTIEAVEKNEKLLSLREKLRSTGTTIEELGEFETLLLGRAEKAVAVALEYEHRAVEAIASSSDHNLSQTDMNLRASQAANRADERLQFIFAELSANMSVDDVRGLRDAQAAWEDYRRKHVSFCGMQYLGGSIRPLIEGLAFESVTINRMVELETELHEIQRLRQPSD